MMRLPFGLSPKRDTHTGPRYGDVYPRAVAAGIDLALMFVLLNDFFMYTRDRILAGVNTELFYQVKSMRTFSEMWHPLWDSHFLPLIILSYLFEIAVIGIVLVSVQILFGTTPGKWLVGLKIVDAKTHLPIAKWRYIVRYVAYIPSVAPLMLGMIWANFNPERRAWHDRIAGTVVLNMRPPGWYWKQILKLVRRLRGKPEPVSADTPQNIE